MTDKIDTINILAERVRKLETELKKLLTEIDKLKAKVK